MLDILAQSSPDLSSPELDAAVDTALAGLRIFLFTLFAFWLFFVACMWKILSKAGQPGWACLVPIYINYVLVQAIRKPISWFILSLIPLISLVYGIMILHEISKNFGRGSGTTLGLIFLPVIFLPMLAFGSAQWQGEQQAA